MGARNQETFAISVEKLEMSDCKGSVSPKLDKSCIEGDSEELGEEQASRFRSAVLTLLCLSNVRTDIQSTVRLLCTKLKSPTVLEMRQLKRLLRYVKNTEDMSTVFEMRDNSDRRGRMVKRLEVYTDSDWASDQVTRKSTSGAVIMAEGMRLHAHSRVTGFSGIEQLRSRGNGSVSRHQGGIVVARGVDVCWFGTLRN